MKKILLIMVGMMIFNQFGYSQNIAITDDDGYTADPSAMLDVKSLTKGMLVPRLDSSNRKAISSPATGLLVFDTDYLAFYFYNGSGWINLTASTDQIWNASGDSVFLANSSYKIGVGSSSPKGKLEIKGSGTDETLLVVVNSTNDTVFAVYDQGVRINVDDNDVQKSTGNRAGFAVGGFSSSKGTITNEYLRITPDSVRIYVNDNTIAKTTGNRGGFAVGGFSSSKGVLSNEYFRITNDSVRVYVDPNAKSTGNRGGFAVGGFSGSKGTSTDFMNITEDNYLIGYGAGYSLSDGVYNSFMGYEAGYLSSTANNNIYLGYQAGYTSTDDENNIFIGNNAGYLNDGPGNWDGNDNVFIGNNSGSANVIGHDNVYIGNLAGSSNTSTYNVMIGSDAGTFSTGGFNTFYGKSAGNSSDGSHNVFVGMGTGKYNETGGSNTYIGGRTGFWDTGGSQNVLIGYGAGELANGQSLGSRNIFIGYDAGDTQVGVSNKLIIEPSNSATPLIEGDFSADELTINGDFYSTGIGDFTGNLSTAGTLDVTGAVTFDNTLSVVSSAQFGNTMSVSGNTTVGGTLGVTGALSTSSTLNAGNTSISGTLNVSSISTLNSSTTINGNLTLGGNVFRIEDHVTFSLKTGLPLSNYIYQGLTSCNALNEAVAINDGLYVQRDVWMPELNNNAITTGSYLKVNSVGLIGYASSSRRYKENIVDMEDIEWLYNLRPVNFKL